ncbi:MAG TPA: class III poly(R)-hydroxyalkanoic acid synthase subunit PhaE [Lysobacter sp.]|nr:class III poly(R)-hydroxyalkanoic acid synthase subunit PhaE [Lysobacter sp.]
MAATAGSDFEALARQYWDFWTDAMRQGAAAAGAQGAESAARTPQAAWERMGEEAMQTLGAQARGWYGQMQQLAAQFAGRAPDAREVAETWRRMLSGAGGGNVFAELLRGMQGPGQQGFDAWYEQVRPFLQGLPMDAWQREARSWLGLPAFGFAREHQERWQKLAQAHLDYVEQSGAYQALLAEATQDAFGRFERKLAERGEGAQPVTSARALFDLWIDAAEEAYAEVALSPRFRDAYGRFVNAQMRLRAGVQREVEQLCSQFGMPTRTEMDAAHRKITQLERELRRLRDTLPDQAAPAAAERTQAKPRRASTASDTPRPKRAAPAAPAKGGKKKRAG